jgi:hypothetical protein
MLDPLKVFLVTIPTMHEVGGLENPQRKALAAFAQRIKNGGAEEALAAQIPWLRYQRESPALDPETPRPVKVGRPSFQYSSAA